MSNRIQAGGGLAALALGLGGLGVSQRWGPLIYAGIFVLAGVILLLTVANRLWLLHKCPVFGSPKLWMRAYLDGRGDNPDGALTLRIPASGDRTAMLNVKIRNPAWIDVSDANVGLLVTEGIRRWRVDHEGRPFDEGRWIKPTYEPIGSDDPRPWKDYWVARARFPGREMDADWWFKLRFKRPGDYRLRLMIDSPVLYGKGLAEDFHVSVVKLDGEPTTVERLDAVLDEGEQLLRLRPDAIVGDPFGKRYFAWVLAAAHALPEEYMEGFNDLQAEDTKPDAHADRDELKALLAYVYEARRRIGGDQP